MAYEVGRDILGPNHTPPVQPGGSITAAELGALLDAATSAAVAGNQQANAMFARALFILASKKAKGDWHVLPDLFTMLTKQWLVLDGGNSSEGWLPALRNALSSSLKGAVRNLSSDLYRSDVVDLMLYSCLKPDQPLDIKEVGLKAEPGILAALCSM
jgi:hypothetical protein